MNEKNMTAQPSKPLIRCLCGYFVRSDADHPLITAGTLVIATL